MVVVHTFNPSLLEAQAGRSMVKANLVYRVSSRTAKAAQRNPVLKKQQQKQTKTKAVPLLLGAMALSSCHATYTSLSPEVQGMCDPIIGKTLSNPDP